MSTTTRTPLDQAAYAVSEAGVALDAAYDTMVRAERFYAARVPGYTRTIVEAARVNYAANVTLYDTARILLEAELAKRPDVLVCTCGAPECSA